MTIKLNFCCSKSRRQWNSVSFSLNFSEETWSWHYIFLRTMKVIFLTSSPLILTERGKYFNNYTKKNNIYFATSVLVQGGRGWVGIVVQGRGRGRRNSWASNLRSFLQDRAQDTPRPDYALGPGPQLVSTPDPTKSTNPSPIWTNIIVSLVTVTRK